LLGRNGGSARPRPSAGHPRAFAAQGRGLCLPPSTTRLCDPLSCARACTQTGNSRVTFRTEGWNPVPKNLRQSHGGVERNRFLGLLGPPPCQPPRTPAIPSLFIARFTPPRERRLRARESVPRHEQRSLGWGRCLDRSTEVNTARRGPPNGYNAVRNSSNAIRRGRFSTIDKRGVAVC